MDDWDHQLTDTVTWYTSGTQNFLKYYSRFYAESPWVNGSTFGYFLNFLPAKNIAIKHKLTFVLSVHGTPSFLETYRAIEVDDLKWGGFWCLAPYFPHFHNLIKVLGVRQGQPQNSFSKNKFFQIVVLRREMRKESRRSDLDFLFLHSFLTRVWIKTILSSPNIASNWKIITTWLLGMAWGHEIWHSNIASSSFYQCKYQEFSLISIIILRSIIVITELWLQICKLIAFLIALTLFRMVPMCHSRTRC